MLLKSTNQRIVYLIILDGWGYRATKKNNGIELASKPFFDGLLKKYPNTLIKGSGPAVGLPNNIMGNSEVGHMNIGAGRIVYTGLSQIYNAIEKKEFFSNPSLLQAINQVKKANSTLHIMGLLSDGAVHSHQDHLYALLDLAKQNQISNVAIHCFMDGRDTPPQEGIKYLKQLQNKITEIGVGIIASLEGRYYAMDRDKRWDRNKLAFDAICGQCKNTTLNPLTYLEDSYKQNIGDEFIKPVCLKQDNQKTITISESDAMIFYNFRADRAKQITKAFTEINFSNFDRKNQALPAVFVCMAPYDKEIKAPIAFIPSYPINTLGEVVAKHGLKQLRIAETEKYAHVTFFLNGGCDTIFDQEDRVLIPSPREVATYDKKPEMSAFEVKNKMLQIISDNKYSLVVLNFANADMVGHTAKPQAIKKAVETIDQCLSEIIPKILEKEATAFIFADHGNAEEMIDAQGEPMTAHTTNPVPFIVVSNKPWSRSLKPDGRLCDVAPTALSVLGIKQPKEMTGICLFSD